MKRYITILSLMVSLLLTGLTGCGRRNMLSDEELAQVFRDAYLSNAYTSMRTISLDSLKLYEPIFNKYGYTVDDVQYTIGSFSTRKSARLSDVVERAISMLEVEGIEYDRQVAILDTVDNIAIRRASKIVYADSLLEYHSLSDTTAVNLTFDDLEPGQYLLTFCYLVDSLDTSRRSYTSRYWLERDVARRVKVEGSDDEYETVIDNREYSPHTMTLRRGSVGRYRQSIKVDNDAERVQVRLVNGGDEDDVERSVRIKDLKITRVPEVEEARRVAVEELMNLTIFGDGMFNSNAQDRL